MRLPILLVSLMLAPLVARAQVLDYAFFKKSVQPIFLEKQPGGAVVRRTVLAVRFVPLVDQKGKPQ